MMFLRGNGVERDFKAAMAWLKTASERGQSIAKYHIGLLYWDGDGVDRDLEEARRWIQESADEGCEEARQWLSKHAQLSDGESQCA